MTGIDLAEAELDQGKGIEKMALSVSESVLLEKPLPTPAWKETGLPS